MRLSRSHVLAAAAAAVVLAFSLFGFVPDAFAATAALKGAGAHSWLGDVIAASPALILLRKEIDDLGDKAKRKLAELVDDMAPEAARAIEADHAAILRDIEAKRSEAVRLEEAAGATDVVAAERKRSADIIALGARHNMASDIVQRAIADGTSLDAFRGVVLDEIAKGEPARRIASGGASVTVLNPGESPAERSSAMIDGIILRALNRDSDYVPAPGQPKIGNGERAREFAGMRLLEIGAEMMGIRNAHRLPIVQLYEQVAQRAMMGSSDFPLLLSAAANKFLLAQYQYQMPSYRRFSVQKTFNDFKAHQFLRAGDFPTLQALSETGEFRNGSLSENKESVTAATYGRIVALSRQMFVNDDLGAFSDLTGSAGRRVADFENGLAWTYILANGNLSDGGALYNTTAVTTGGGHANLAASGTVVDVTNVSAGRKAIRTKKSLDGVPLNMDPKIIVAGPAKQTDIEQLLSTQLLATQVSNVNPFNGGGLTRLEPVIDAYITDNSWYLFADPNGAPVFIYGYVSGFNGPRFAVDQPFRGDGLALKVSEDFGFGAVDFKGSWKNPGA